MTTGKSKRPPPLRDARIDDAASVPRQEEAGRVSLNTLRRAEREDVERLRAARAAEADDYAALLVRLAKTERERDAAEQKVLGLERWTQVVEAKVAEARTKVDELRAQAVSARGGSSRESSPLDPKLLAARAGFMKVLQGVTELEQKERELHERRGSWVAEARALLGAMSASWPASAPPSVKAGAAPQPNPPLSVPTPIVPVTSRRMGASDAPPASQRAAADRRKAVTQQMPAIARQASAAPNAPAKRSRRPPPMSVATPGPGAVVTFEDLNSDD